MLDAKVVLAANEKMFYFFGITAILLFSALFPTEISAQPRLGSSVYGDTKKPTVRTVAKPKVVIRKNVAPAAAAKKANRPPAKVPNTAARNLLSVTFTTRDPKVEIWLDDKRIGVTDENRQFVKKLAPGEYKILAKTNRQVLFPTQKITITAEKTNIELIDPNLNRPKPASVAFAEPKEQEKSEIEIAREISAKVKEILETFGDPKTTDSVTLQDWEIVFQAAQLGQLQNYTAVQIEAHRWFASGQIELAKNEIENAFTAFNKAQEYMPQSALPFYGLGNTYSAKRQYQDALKLYQRAVQLDPKFALGYRKLGDTYRKLNKEKEAIAAYKNAVLFGYKTPETRYLLGMMYLQNKQVEEGVAELEDVVKDTPRADIFITIGEAYEKIKRGVSAIENYQKAIYLEPNSAIAYYKLGSAYYEQREYGKAKESLEKAIELDAEGKVMSRAESQKKLREAASKINR